MIFDLAVAAAQHARVVLLSGLALVVLGVGAGWVAVPAAIAGIMLALLLVCFGAPSMRRPRPSFSSWRTPRTIVYTLAGVGHFALIGIFTLHLGDFTAPKDKIILALTVLSFLVYLPAMWRGVGLTVTASGVRAEKWSGSVVVPWEALADEPPTGERGAVRVVYARPDLVQVSGWTANRAELPCEGTDPRFAAAVISYYVRHPEERAAISPDAVAPTVPEEPEPPADRATALTVLVVSAVVLALAVAGEAWVDDESLLGWLVHIGAGIIATAAGLCVIGAVKDLRQSGPR
ncbi:hypothetical protein AB0J83_00100 [Actinoplanes sp. NPDC049596]|uniref:hypothetical protein n=1 Tax=unclassified Actinoplanes TaxID=2626549 RepID=UPI003431B3C4